MKMKIGMEREQSKLKGEKQNETKAVNDTEGRREEERK